jgi:protein-S-isoprenylcysteine O-methyltransferase Ste14
VLAWRTPTSTHHFAPLVVAAAWGFLADAQGPSASRRAAAAGVAVAVITLIVLGVTGHLSGPTLWHSRPSWPELLGFAALGGVITLVRGRFR